MSMSSMPSLPRNRGRARLDVRIVEDQAPEVRGSAVVFPALDLDSELEVWVTALH